MCWSKKVSISMFILGTVFNVLVWKLLNNDKQIKVLILTSQFILFMQLFDAIIWSHQPCSDVRNNKINKKVNVVQMVFNLLQPIVFFALSIVYMRAEISDKNKNIAFFIICFYMLYFAILLIKQYRSQCSEPVDEHLRYYWWDQLSDGYFSGSIFFIVMTALFLLLIVPYKFALVVVIYSAISFLISILIYGINNSGVVGHMWCFYQVILPLVVYFGYISVVNK